MCKGCHVAVIKCEITHLTALKFAVERLGGILHLGQRTYKWWGYSVEDYPIPKGMTKDDLGKCQHAISFPGCEYEIGVTNLFSEKGYQLVWDFIDDKLQKKVGGQDACKLVQAYAIEEAKQIAQEQGLACWEVQCEDGTIEVHVNVGE